MEVSGHVHALAVVKECSVLSGGLKNCSERGDEDSNSAAIRIKAAVVCPMA
jgi:hypothetical protein